MSRTKNGDRFIAALSFLMGVSFMVGCASTDLTAAQEAAKRDQVKALEVANELEREDRHDPARKQAQAIAEAAPEVADDMRLRVCSLFEQDGELRRARQCYLELQKTLAQDQDRALAAYRAASLAARQGEVGPALDGELTAVIARWPSTDAGARALQLLQALAHERGGARAEVDVLRKVAASIPPDAEPATIQLRLEAEVEAARLLLNEMNDAESARRLLEETLALAKGTAWYDDALIALARAYRAANDLPGAARAYRELIDERESSWFVGSYDSRFLDEAYMELGELYETHADLLKAREVYNRLVDERPSSRWADDAAFAAARISALYNDLEPLKRFVKRFPESRHVEQAKRWLARAE